MTSGPAILTHTAKSTTKSRRAFLAIVAAAALCAETAAITQAQPPIRIGATLAQTGPYAAPGQNQLRGYRLCVKHTNEKGGVLGRRIDLIVEDDQSKVSTAVAIYEKLITQNKVDAILGPYFMMFCPGEVYLEGVIDVAAKRGLKTAALIHEDTLFPGKPRFPTPPWSQRP